MPHTPPPPSNRSRARSMRKRMTDAELKLWNEVRAHRLMGLGFRRQFPIGSYVVDFACPSKRLIVEIDGSQHGEDETAHRDAVRTRFLDRTAGPCSASGTTTCCATSTASACIL